MNDLVEVVAVIGIATSLVVVVYGLVMLQSQVFTALSTKCALLSAKLAQFVSDCYNDFLLIACPDYLALSMIQLLAAIVSDCLRLLACA